MLAWGHLVAASQGEEGPEPGLESGLCQCEPHSHRVQQRDSLLSVLSKLLITPVILIPGRKKGRAKEQTIVNAVCALPEQCFSKVYLKSPHYVD